MEGCQKAPRGTNRREHISGCLCVTLEMTALIIGCAAGPHSRPRFGYNRLRVYRAWLRDDVAFSLVYCLYVSKWAGDRRVRSDHFVPQKPTWLERQNTITFVRVCVAI